MKPELALGAALVIAFWRDLELTFKDIRRYGFGHALKYVLVVIAVAFAPIAIWLIRRLLRWFYRQLEAGEKALFILNARLKRWDRGR